eukprot:369269_1
MADSNAFRELSPYVPYLIALVLGLTIVFLFFGQQKQQDQSILSQRRNAMGSKQLQNDLSKIQNEIKEAKRKDDEDKEEEEEDEDEYNDEDFKQLQEKNAAKLSEKRKGMRENELAADLNELHDQKDKEEDDINQDIEDID